MFLVLSLRLSRTLLAPWLDSDLAFSFRSDNFFSFSGGQLRRGLLGELLFQGQSLGFPSILIYSIGLLAIFGFLYLYLFPRLLRSFSQAEVLIIIFSGLFLMPSIDREVFILGPAVYYYFRRQLDFGFFLLLGFTAFIHEISLLLYFPCILWVLAKIWTEKRWSYLPSIAFVGLSFASVILFKGDMNLIPEREFWPAYGVIGLEDHFLYTFTGKGLLATLKLHASIILGKSETFLAIPGFVAFFGIVLFSLRRYGASAMTTVYYFVITLIFCTLTLDYGRYFYLLFFFYLLLSQSGLLLKVDEVLEPFQKLVPSVIKGSLSFDFKHRGFLIFLSIFALAPFGYWLGDTILEPAFLQEFQQLWNFELPKYAGE